MEKVKRFYNFTGEVTQHGYQFHAENADFLVSVFPEGEEAMEDNFITPVVGGASLLLMEGTYIFHKDAKNIIAEGGVNISGDDKNVRLSTLIVKAATFKNVTLSDMVFHFGEIEDSCVLEGTNHLLFETDDIDCPLPSSYDDGNVEPVDMIVVEDVTGEIWEYIPQTLRDAGCPESVLRKYYMELDMYQEGGCQSLRYVIDKYVNVIEEEDEEEYDDVEA